MYKELKEGDIRQKGDEFRYTDQNLINASGKSEWIGIEGYWIGEKIDGNDLLVKAYRRLIPEFSSWQSDEQPEKQETNG